MVNVSVIIPVFNAEKTIQKALDSALNQSLKSLEIIVVNDGSDDKTETILKKYQEQSNVIVINQRNSGVSVARNRGIAEASGDYLFFLDADDYLEEGLLFEMYELAKLQELDLVACAYEEENSTRYGGNVSQSQDFIARTADDISQHFLDIFPQSAAAKLFRKSLIDKVKLSFPKDMHLGEDLYFTYSYLMQVESLGFTGQYKYRIQNVNDESLSKRFVPNMMADILIQHELWEKLVAKYPQIDQVYHKSKMDFRYYLLALFANNFEKFDCPCSYQEKKKELKKGLLEYSTWLQQPLQASKKPKNKMEWLTYYVLRTRNATLILAFFNMKEKIKRYKRRN